MTRAIDGANTVARSVPGILYRRRVLVVHNGLDGDRASARATAGLIAALNARDIDVIDAASATEAQAQIAMHSLLQAVLIDWDLAGAKGHAAAKHVIAELRARAANLPIFLLAASGAVEDMPAEVLAEVNDYVWLFKDTTDFIGGRIVAAIDRYRATLLPPMFKALANFASQYEYSWHTPGHAGGTAFMKHPAGRAFVEFFGEELFRSDLSISVGEVGSLLDHSGPIGEAERNAARVFGADRTYFVTNGSSTSNRVILMASVTRDQIALCDRNCHKSVEHAMTLSGAIPTYLMPSRNYLGLIGPIPSQRLEATAVRQEHRGQPARHGRHRPGGRACRDHQLHLRRAVLRRRARRGVDRAIGGSPALRRGLVRLRALQPALCGALRDARRSGHAARRWPDAVRDAVDAQAARSALAGVVHPHPRRPPTDSPRALQRGVHDARVDLAAVRDHRVQRHRRSDDGRPLRRGAHRRVHRRGDRVPADAGAPACRVQGEGRLVLRSLATGHRRRGQGSPQDTVPSCRSETAGARSKGLDAASAR